MTDQTPRRIGLLGGTFDPPHIGHLVVAEVARDALDLDEVWLVVAGEPWMKAVCSPREHRVAMVELAVHGNDALRASRLEVDRAGVTYTIDTLRQIAAMHPEDERFFLVGADAVQHLNKWRDIDECLQLARFVAVTRGGYALVLDDPLTVGLERLDVPLIDVSSTDLRRRFSRGETTRYLLPDAVAEYARRERLYERDA